jgi:hypothetical protein
VSFTFSWLRLATASFAPWTAKSSAMPRLMPLVPPTTSTTFSLKSSLIAIFTSVVVLECGEFVFALYGDNLNSARVSFDSMPCLELLDVFTQFAGMLLICEGQGFEGPLQSGVLELQGTGRVNLKKFLFLVVPEKFEFSPLGDVRLWGQTQLSSQVFVSNALRGKI